MGVDPAAQHALPITQIRDDMWGKKNITVPVPVFTIKKCSLQKQLFCTCAIRSYRIAERNSYSKYAVQTSSAYAVYSRFTGARLGVGGGGGYSCS